MSMKLSMSPMMAFVCLSGYYYNFELVFEFAADTDFVVVVAVKYLIYLKLHFEIAERFALQEMLPRSTSTWRYP